MEENIQGQRPQESKDSKDQHNQAHETSRENEYGVHLSVPPLDQPKGRAGLVIADSRTDEYHQISRRSLALL